MEKPCDVCDLPYLSRKEIEGMLLGGWTPEDLEHWIALRLRIRISASKILHHNEQCYLNPSPGRELIELAKPEPSSVFYCFFPRAFEENSSLLKQQVAEGRVLADSQNSPTTSTGP